MANANVVEPPKAGLEVDEVIWFVVPLMPRVELTRPALGKPVAFVRVSAEGVPRFGVVSVGELENTTLPVPVAPPAVTPPIEMFVPKVCNPLQVCAALRLASVRPAVPS